jgi:pyridoxamine 5'-phosphate oxidase
MVKNSQYTNQFVINEFNSWFLKAQEFYKKLKLDNANAMSLCTVDESMQPSNRMVLLKNVNESGFVFFTNYESKKAKSIEINNKVSLLFYWLPLNKQVRIEGEVEKISKEESEKYFHSRPYLSKIGAWASKQSSEMKSSMDLHKEIIKYTAKFKTSVPYAEHWGGYVVKPNYVEFWEEKPFRLHNRVVYIKQKDNEWLKKHIYP